MFFVTSSALQKTNGTLFAGYRGNIFVWTKGPQQVPLCGDDVLAIASHGKVFLHGWFCSGFNWFVGSLPLLQVTRVMYNSVVWCYAKTEKQY